MIYERMNFSPAPLPLATIISNIRNVSRGGLDLQPEYQRDYIWSQDFKEKLIYSLIKRYPIGSISIRNLEYENAKHAKMEVVDGQQRLTTLYNFITGSVENNNNDFKIGNEYARKIINEIVLYLGADSEDKDVIKLNNKLSKKGNIVIRYTDLPFDIKEDIKAFPLSITTISNTTTDQISEYFRFLQNQESLRAGEIVKSFPHTYLEKYLYGIKDKKTLLKTLNYKDPRLEFDKLVYSMIGLFDKAIPFGSQDKTIKEYVFHKQTELNSESLIFVNNMIDNLNIISESNIMNDFNPTKRYLKLILLLCAFNKIDFSNIDKILTNLSLIDSKLAKFSSVAPNALEEAFGEHGVLIEDYRKFAELSVRTHSFATVQERMEKLPVLINDCPF